MNKYWLSFLWTGVILMASGAVAETEITVHSDQTVTGDADIYQAWDQTQFHNGSEGSAGYHLKTDAGSILHMNTNFAPSGADKDGLSGTVIENYGVMETGGQGWAVFADVMPNQRAKTTVENYGQMWRINLGETGKDAASFLGEGSRVKNYQDGIIHGSVLMGTNATLENYGKMSGFDQDELPERYSLNNLI